MTIVQISAPIFWGYRVYIPNSRFNSMLIEDVIQEVKEDMKTFFKNNNLLELYDRIKDLNLHNHENINIGDEGDIFYLCDHSDIH